MDEQQHAFEDQEDQQESLNSPTEAQTEDQRDLASEQPPVGDVPHVPLATGQHMPVQSGSLAAAKDALAAQKAAERAVDEQGEDAHINTHDFRSIASPLPSGDTPPNSQSQPAPSESIEDEQDMTR